MRTMAIIMAAIAAFGSGAPVLGQAHDAGHGAASGVAAAAPASTRAYSEAAARMHEAMAIPYTGDADVDFMQGMLPHHQGAIDMARILLDHGADPETRALAEAIIAAQTREITQITAWLKARGR